MIQVVVYLQNKIYSFRERLKNRRGASMVEYAILIAVIAIAVIAAARLLGKQISSTMQNVTDELGNL